jgi:hypothetical protein
MINLIFNHPVLNPMQVFGAVYLGTFTGSLKDPLILLAYSIALFIGWKRFSVFWIVGPILMILFIRQALSTHWSSEAGLADEDMLDRLLGSSFIFSQVGIIAGLARMFSGIQVSQKPNHNKADSSSFKESNE